MKETKTKANTTVPPSKPEPDPIDWSQYAGNDGYAKTTTEDLGIPFLTILQKGSPEVDRTHKNHQAKKIPGAQAGCIINSVTRTIIYTPEEEPAIVVPCFYEKHYVEWKPRESNGGFVKQHPNPSILENCTRNEKNQDILPNGNLIVTTAYFLALLQNENDTEKVVISMTSTQLKKARAWLNMMMAIKQNGRPLPMFSHKYAISTMIDQNANGSWYGWQIAGVGPVTDRALLEEAVSIVKKMSVVNPPQISNTTDDVPL